jgi:hypothetical protein
MNPDKVRVKEITVTVVHVMPFLRHLEVKETETALVHSYVNRLAMAAYQVDEALGSGQPAGEIIVHVLNWAVLGGLSITEEGR